MITTYNAVINQEGSVSILQNINIKEPKRALLVVFDDDVEENINEKHLPYILSEKSLSKDWERLEEDMAWEYLK